MLIIPPEISLSIIDHAEPPALRALRATSRTLCVLATPQAFRVLSCTGTERSTFCFDQLMARPLVADQVQEIDYSCENTDSADLPDILSDSPLHDLRHLPSLHTLAYTFPRNISSDPLINSLVHLQRDALTALNDTIPASLRSLTLHNIAPYHVICPNADRIFSELDLKAWSPFPPLTHLHVSTADTERGDEGHTRNFFLYLNSNAFAEALIYPLLDAVAGSLTSLELHIGTEALWRNWPQEDLHCPRFTHLTFGWYFDAVHPGVEQFVLAHRRTLQELKLVRCAVLLPSNGTANVVPFVPQRTWAHIYERLRVEMTGLRRMEVVSGEGPAYWRQDSPLEYTKWHDDGCAGQDEMALQSLLEDVSLR